MEVDAELCIEPHREGVISRARYKWNMELVYINIFCYSGMKNIGGNDNYYWYTEPGNIITVPVPSDEVRLMQ